MNATDYYEHYWSQEGLPRQGNIWPALQDLYEAWIPKGTRVLDVGCGDGLTSGAWLAANGRIYRGVDISSAAVSSARGAGLDAAEISDAGSLPFEPNSFDAVVCIEVLEHLFDPAVALREITRILKPGGLFVATVPNVAYWRTRLELAIGRWNPMGDMLSVKAPWRDPHIRFFTIPSMRRFIQASDLSLVHVGGQNGGVFKSLPYLRRFAKLRASPLYCTLEKLSPSVLGAIIEVVCRKT